MLYYREYAVYSGKIIHQLLKDPQHIAPIIKHVVTQVGFDVRINARTDRNNVICMVHHTIKCVQSWEKIIVFLLWDNLYTAHIVIRNCAEADISNRVVGYQTTRVQHCVKEEYNSPWCHHIAETCLLLSHQKRERILRYVCVHTVVYRFKVKQDVYDAPIVVPLLKLLLLIFCVVKSFKLVRKCV